MQCGIIKVYSALSQRVILVWGRLIIFRGPSGTRWKNIDFGEFLRSAHGGYHGFAPGLPCCIRQPTKSHHHYQHHHNNYGTNIATIGSSNKCYTHQNIKASTAVFLTALVGCVNIWITELGKGSTEKNVFFRALPEWYSILSSKLTFKSWISTSEKRGPSCPNWCHGWGGLGNSGNARKQTFFFHWGLPLP